MQYKKAKQHKNTAAMSKSFQSFLDVSSLKYEKLQTKFQTIFVINQLFSTLFSLFQFLQTETKTRLSRIKISSFFVS